MSSVTSGGAGRRDESMEWQLRVDLAAAFRLSADLGWHEAVANHFSLAVTADGKKFLMNPRWRHFARVKASELLLLDSDDTETMSRPDAPDASAWCIHGHLHGSLPQARCILHCHPPYATAIAALADPEIKPIEQNTARYYRRLAIDREFGGIADNDEEGRRLVRVHRRQEARDPRQPRGPGHGRHGGRGLRRPVLPRARLPDAGPGLLDRPAAQGCSRTRSPRRPRAGGRTTRTRRSPTSIS